VGKIVFDFAHALPDEARASEANTCPAGAVAAPFVEPGLRVRSAPLGGHRTQSSSHSLTRACDGRDREDHRVRAATMPVSTGRGRTGAGPARAPRIEKASRLYEQEGGAGFASAALEMRVKRWMRWSASGLVLDPRPLEVPLA
jgi:hypothetical protein